ncbi:MAG: hypothetical protein ACJ0BN_05285 [Limisphaerales bacterium]|jgi:hypothetical protein|nr:hypothetical protein [Pedosphaera sp.]MBL6843957.1 hypothetical protein [Verrucomicrobiae bacterium]RZO70732.1 MAG: hypothetical protein EVA71_06770 [Limisphaerales bacterium]HBP57487.1 hypothetical protein [Verrucomicrobiales bacterium]HCP38887.1 hypothetical protein [Verrucomicrobiales bacterium]
MGKNKKGCLFYGCLTSIILGLVFFIAVPLALYYGFNVAAGKLIENYTDKDPIQLPEVVLGEAELSMLKQRVERFRKAIQTNEASPPLELTAEEINALIFHDTQLEKLKGRAYLKIEGNALQGQVSIPLDELNLNSDDRRYINGSGRFKISVREGKLSVIIQSIEIKGKTLPAAVQNVITGVNLFENAEMDQETTKLLDRLKTFEIQNGKLLLELNRNREAEIDDALDFNGGDAL